MFGENQEYGIGSCCRDNEIIEEELNNPASIVTEDRQDIEQGHGEDQRVRAKGRRVQSGDRTIVGTSSRW